MKRVLIADDEPIERMIVSRTVEKYFSEELTVVSAANGREAVEQFFAGDCQIALLDIEMPGMNGLEAAEQIRKRDKNCSIIFLTAFDEFNYAKRAIAVRAMEYLLKPVEDQELVAVLEEAVRIAEEQETDREAGEKKSAEQISTERDCHEDTADTERSRIRLQAVAGNIQAFIEHNYMDDISLQTVAEAMNYSDAYFCKIFKQCFDKNFIVYLSEYRVARAKELLGDVLINVKDVSQKVGYRDSNYFAKVFKRIAGVTPTEYRMQVLKEAGRAMRRICAAAVVAGMTILLTLSAWKNHTYLSKTEVEPEYVFSYAENQPEDYPTTLGAKYFAELVEERTNGAESGFWCSRSGCSDQRIKSSNRCSTAGLILRGCHWRSLRNIFRA